MIEQYNITVCLAFEGLRGHNFESSLTEISLVVSTELFGEWLGLRDVTAYFFP